MEIIETIATTKNTTSTSITTTEENIYIEPMVEDVETEGYIYEEPEVIIEDVDIIDTTENSDETENVNAENNETYYGSFEATWYEGGVGTYGYSGRDLISGYSVASNYFAQGTILRIVGNGLDGIYRVDDRGGMADNVVDFYYQYGDVPSDFRYRGRVNIEVYVVE